MTQGKQLGIVLTVALLVASLSSGASLWSRISRALRITPSLTITTKALTIGTVGNPYSSTLTATGGKTPYTWIVAPLPAGVKLSGSSIAGTPVGVSNILVTLKVRDKSGATMSTTLPLAVCPVFAITTAVLPPGTVGVPYNVQFLAVGGVVQVSPPVCGQ